MKVQRWVRENDNLSMEELMTSFTRETYNSLVNQPLIKEGTSIPSFVLMDPLAGTTLLSALTTEEKPFAVNVSIQVQNNAGVRNVAIDSRFHTLLVKPSDDFYKLMVLALEPFEAQVKELQLFAQSVFVTYHDTQNPTYMNQICTSISQLCLVIQPPSTSSPNYVWFTFQLSTCLTTSVPKIKNACHAVQI
jgi:hypothetical protein